MQSRGDIRKIQEYAIGEHIREGEYDTGKVVAIAAHPAKKSIGYLLLVNSHDEYTIYRGASDVRCGLALARRIPESVAMQFAAVIQGAESPPSPYGPVPKKNGKKYPVISKPEPEPVPEDEQETGAPYFDFV